jgi:hypothetical protein
MAAWVNLSMLGIFPAERGLDVSGIENTALAVTLWVIKRVFGSDVRHIQPDGIRAEANNNRSERLQGAFRQRTKVLRGLQSRGTGQLFLDG